MEFEKDVILKTEKFVKEELFKEASGHDWYHIDRVRKLANRLGKEENANLFIVELASLLHDIGDYKLQGDNDDAPKLINDWLQKLNVNQLVIETVIKIVDQLSFAKSLDKKSDKLSCISKEAKIVCDADRIDAIGAVGIARTFAFGACCNRLMYDPDIKPRTNLTSEEYKKNKGTTTINHFYEKLLKLKDKMYTDTGKKIAEGRHQFMELYLEHFYSEWNGEK